MMRLRSLPDDGEEDRVVAMPLGAASARPGAARIDPLLAATLDPAGPLAAPIDRLRVQLAGVRRADGTPARLLAIAGVDAPDEAALLTAALALRTARGGYRTLLVDACLGRPTLHALLGCDDRAGLATLLTARLAGEAIQPTGEAALSLVAAGPAPAGGDTLLDGARLFGALRTMTDRFQSILVLGAGEAGLLAATGEGLDGVVLVVRRDVSSTRRLQAAAAALAERGTPLLGVVRVD